MASGGSEQTLPAFSRGVFFPQLNQIGTVSECMKAAQKAKENGWTLFVSHRSGETEVSSGFTFS
jgi:hypothetical protein